MSEKLPSSTSRNSNNIKQLRVEFDPGASAVGRVMPQAISTEEAILGAIMIDENAMSIIVGILTPESFYKPAHKTIYAVMVDLFEGSVPIDILSVKEHLKKSGDLKDVGGPAFLAELTNKVGTAANLEHHARFIAQKHIQRELIRIGTETVKDAFEDTKDVFDMLDEAERNLFDITQQNMSRGFQSVKALTIEARRQIEELSKKEDGLTGVPSGYTDLDNITSGWQPSDLIIVAARPSMGKTALTLCYARNAAVDFNMGVAIFSLEMSGVQLTQRLISMEARVSGSALRNGRIKNDQWHDVNTAMDRISEAPIFIDDTPGINIFELRAKCRRLKMQHDIKMIIIDYLQLMSGGADSKNKGNREQEISGISRALKGLAKELDVPVIALSQLSRAVETRGGNKKPILSDLRESGAIEQDADIVTFIYRPEYYELQGGDSSEQMHDMEGNVAEVIIAKHRNGALGTVELNFVKEYAVFENKSNFDFGAQLRRGGGSHDDGSMFVTRESSLNGPPSDLPPPIKPPNLDEDVPF